MDLVVAIAAAKKLEPPEDPAAMSESDLVDLTEFIPGLVIDLRYATENNFLGARFYSGSTPLLQRPVAQDLREVQRVLENKGIGLIVYDAYRPWWVTRVFRDASPQEHHGFLADPAKGSRHNRGCAIDIGLVRLNDGLILEMPSDFDEFSPRAFVTWDQGSQESLDNRDLLIETMESNNFSVNPSEWWHFDHKSWPKYPILNSEVP